jgi:hypothetical protein
MSEPVTSPAASGDRKVLLILARPQGFFSLVFQVLGQSYLAEKAGATPVVYFNRLCPYWSEAGYEGARNVWEYFFEPLSELSIHDLFPAGPEFLETATLEQFTDLARSTNIAVTDAYPDVVEYWSPIGVYAELNFVHRLTEKFLVLKPGIRAKVEAYQQTHFAGGPVIGVHYRGMEKVVGKIRDGVVLARATHLRYAFLAEIRKQLEQRPGARIFVATDSAQFLEAVLNQFGEAVIYRDASRLDKENETVGLHFSQEAEQNGARLAEEVLLDTLLLARSDFFVHGISNVSNAALFLNPALPHCDMEMKTSGRSIYLRRELYRRAEKRFPRLISGIKRALGRGPRG